MAFNEICPGRFFCSVLARGKGDDGQMDGDCKGLYAGSTGMLAEPVAYGDTNKQSLVKCVV